ncbi:hypothetical protein [Abyssalbus ytuae]|uniref:Uncharacterized protein n=1 Tax=Abyssalbus ytuae TaxID=2926907 RepID=A0A9E7CUU4_9FLAO|nr:hypothetical protein [Abyssalbus ytuae]UOB18972.1 hypothetical protein MQE35_06665 [Abyssalbus ytuae]
MKKFIVIILLLLFIMPFSLNAQCAMCRAVLESGEGQEVARGINNGIIYLMAVPYILVGILGYFIYKKLKS